jgi:hypothetical protein
MKRSHHSSPPSPSEAWIEAFAAECTAELWKKALQYAARRAAAVRRVNSAADAYYERELVQDAIGDTALGVVQWDPSARSLVEHICSMIRTRTSHDYRRANRFPRESFHAGQGDAVELVAEVERALEYRTRDSDAVLGSDADRLAGLRTSAASDPDVLAILNAVEAGGARTKADVMRHAELSENAYHAARARLGRLQRPDRPKKGA